MQVAVDFESLGDCQAGYIHLLSPACEASNPGTTVGGYGYRHNSGLAGVETVAPDPHCQ